MKGIPYSRLYLTCHVMIFRYAVLVTTDSSSPRRAAHGRLDFGRCKGQSEAEDSLSSAGVVCARQLDSYGCGVCRSKTKCSEDDDALVLRSEPQVPTSHPPIQHTYKQPYEVHTEYIQSTYIR